MNCKGSDIFKKVTLPQAVTKYPAFYATRWFITVFTKPHHLSLSSTTLTQSSPTHPMSFTFNNILPSKPKSFNLSSSFKFPHKTPVHALVFSATHATSPCSFIPLHLITRIIFGVPSLKKKLLVENINI